MKIDNDQKPVVIFALILILAIFADFYWMNGYVNQDDTPSFTPVITHFTGFDAITFETSTCDGGCRPYKAIIHGNGEAELLGTELLQGREAKLTLSKDQIATLTDTLNASGFFSYIPKGTEPMCAGPPHQTVTVTVGKDTHSVSHACREPAAQIMQFEKTIVDTLGARKIAEAWFQDRRKPASQLPNQVPKLKRLPVPELNQHEPVTP